MGSASVGQGPFSALVGEAREKLREKSRLCMLAIIRANLNMLGAPQADPVSLEDA